MYKTINIDRFNENFKNNKYIRVYTLQHINVIRDAIIRGKKTQQYYICGRNPSMFDDFDRFCFEQPYKWMLEQMKSKINNFSGDYPIWAWPKRWNIRKSKPLNSNYIFITAIIDKERILPSDFNLWHNVLSNDIITRTEEQYDIYRGNIDPIDTWNDVFDIKLYQKNEIPWLGGNKHRSVQLCCDRIYFDEIIKIRTYHYKENKIRKIYNENYWYDKEMV